MDNRTPPPVEPDPDGTWAHDAMVVAASQGDERAWRRLVHHYKRLVYSIPRGYKLSDEGCDDVFQTMFTVLVRELPRIKDPKSLPKWLITATHRECWRVSKQERSRSSQVNAAESRADLTADIPTDRAAHWERQLTLDRALSDLGGRCERLLRLLYLTPSQVPYEQVGEALGMAVGSVGPTRARCLSKLAELLGGSEIDDRAQP